MLRHLPSAASVTLLVIGGPRLASAQQVSPTTVEITASTENGDNVGERFVYQLREAFRRSAAFKLIEGREARIRIVVNTMNRSPEYPNTSTMYSIVWVLKGENDLPIYLNSTLGFAGSGVLQTGAESIVARTDGIVSDLRRQASSR